MGFYNPPLCPMSGIMFLGQNIEELTEGDLAAEESNVKKN